MTICKGWGEDQEKEFGIKKQLQEDTLPYRTKGIHSSDFPKAWMKYLLEKILCLVIWPPSKPVFTSNFLFWKSSNLQKCWKNSAIKHPCTHYLDSSIINILLYLLFLSFSLTYTQTHIYTNITHILIVFKSHLKLSCWCIS